MKLHRQAHVVHKTQYHIVWVTRYRRKILAGGMAEYFKQAIKEVLEFHPDWHLEEMGADQDHVHLHTLHLIPQKVYWDDGGIWVRGFFVSTAWINEATMRKYVQMQGQQDAGQAKLEL